VIRPRKGFVGSRSATGNVQPDMNVTPLVDVVLVLLIIFMVVTPMLQKGMSVDMVKTRTSKDMPDADKDDAIIVAVTKNGDLFLGTTKIAKEDLAGQIKDRIANRLDKTVFVKSDARAKYKNVVAAVDEIRSAGVDTLGLLTEMVTGPERPVAPPVS
jgi:biopolymer transport protein ExbD